MPPVQQTQRPAAAQGAAAAPVVDKETQAEQSIAAFVRDVVRDLKEKRKAVSALAKMKQSPAIVTATKELKAEIDGVIKVTCNKVQVELEKISKEA